MSPDYRTPYSHLQRRRASFNVIPTVSVVASLLLLCMSPALLQGYPTEEATSQYCAWPFHDVLVLGVDTRSWKTTNRHRQYQLGKGRMMTGISNLLLLGTLPVIRLAVTVLLVCYITGMLHTLLCILEHHDVC